YGLLGARGYWRMAACAGLVIMLLIVASEVRTRSVKIIDCTSLGFFFLAVVALVAAGERAFSRYQDIVGWGLFAVAAWATMIAGVPFRLQYARERAPRALWNKPHFRRVHFHVSATWAIIFTLDAILAAIELGIGHRFVLIVILPAMSMVLGFAFTVLYPAFYRRQIFNYIEHRA
ncbi:MAG TPA: hypothetical protein VMV13_12080, partial [Candidatus Binataceae bacterium]|nr:hypothetical protein [Candidatus Binataceae bacterium]